MTSSIDTISRVAILDLFARYCHSVDHGEPDAWAALFTPDGVFEIAGLMRLEGTEQLRAMPAVVAREGGGKWRHQVTNLVIDEGVEEDMAAVRAYGLVTDWRDGGKLVSFTDYEIMLRRVAGDWLIMSLLARLI